MSNGGLVTAGVWLASTQPLAASPSDSSQCAQATGGSLSSTILTLITGENLSRLPDCALRPLRSSSLSRTRLGTSRNSRSCVSKLRLLQDIGSHALPAHSRTLAILNCYQTHICELCFCVFSSAVARLSWALPFCTGTTVSRRPPAAVSATTCQASAHKKALVHLRLQHACCYDYLMSGVPHMFVSLPQVPRTSHPF
jgi:hypothetical protein